MKWRNHMITGYALAYALTGNYAISLISLPMSIMPDIIEHIPKVKYLKQQFLSHSIIVWGALSLIAYIISPVGGLPAVTAAATGAISHLLCDKFLWRLNQLPALRYLKVRSAIECIIALAAAILTLWYRPVEIPSAEDVLRYAQGIIYHFTDLRFADRVISILPYNVMAIVSLGVAVWMIIFRDLVTYGMGVIVLAVVLFFIGQALALPIP